MKSNRAQNKRLSNPRKRQEQQELLSEVKLRASTIRARRLQAIFGFVSRVVLGATVCASVWLGGKEALRRFVWENPDYFLREINFATDGALTREQVLGVANITEGRNIFTVDLGHARAAIEQMPQVENAVVQRTLPNRMSITLRERRPIAWIAARGEEDPSSSDRSFMIDARGIVLRSRMLLPEYFHLPVISGFETGNLVPGERVNDLGMQAALELIRLDADSTRFQAQNIDLSKGYCLIVTDQQRAKITFGLDRIDKQLDRLYRCLDRAAADHKELQTVNLLVERNVPVTFSEPEAEAPAVEPPAVRPPRPAPAPEERTPLRPVEVRKAEAAPPRSSTKAAATPAHGASGNQALKKPFFQNP